MSNEIATRLKIPKKVKATVIGGYGYSVNFQYAFDFNSPITFSVAVDTNTASASEYNVAEYGIGEYSGGDTAIKQLQAGLGSSGQHMQIGYSVTINGNAIAFQKLDLLMKIGRFIN